MKSSLIRLYHIRDAVCEIFLYTEGLEFEDFDDNTMVQSAVMRQFTVMGEAVKNVSDEIKTKYNHVRWQDIKDFRNVSVHEYFRVETEAVWETILYRLLDLKTEIDIIINELEKNEE